MVTRLRLNNKWKLIFVFFVVVGSIALFEIGEYLLDYFFDMNLQGVFTRDLSGLVRFNLILDRIDDTIIDMILGVVGIAGYVFYKKFRNNSK